MFHNIKASFMGVSGVGLNVMLAMTFLAKPLLVTSLIVFYWYAQLPDWGGELVITFGD